MVSAELYVAAVDRLMPSQMQKKAAHSCGSKNASRGVYAVCRRRIAAAQAASAATQRPDGYATSKSRTIKKASLESVG
jgi:hypothetical protein